MPDAVATLTLNPCVDKSASVARVVAERKMRCGPPRFEPGGGGLNVARALGHLGGAATAVYLAGGPTGALLGRLLDAERVRHVPVPTAGWTRENFIAYDEGAGLQYRFGMPGPEVAAGEWERALGALSALDPAPAWVVVSGSLPPGLPDDACAQVVRAVRQRGGRAIVDTSGPALRGTLEGARGEPADLVKPSVGELAALVGRGLAGPADLEAAARSVVDGGGARAVLVSLGAGGALLATDRGAERLVAPTVPVQSKVGAGDSMVAGVVLALARGRSLSEAARFGVAAGAAAVMTPGTELCRREDAERLYAQLATPANAATKPDA